MIIKVIQKPTTARNQAGIYQTTTQICLAIRIKIENCLGHNVPIAWERNDKIMLYVTV